MTVTHWMLDTSGLFSANQLCICFTVSVYQPDLDLWVVPFQPMLHGQREKQERPSWFK